MPRLTERAAVVRPARSGPRGPAPAARADRRTHRRGSLLSAWPRPVDGRCRSSRLPAPLPSTCTRPWWRRSTRGCRWCSSPPTVRPRCAAPARTRRSTSATCTAHSVRFYAEVSVDELHAERQAQWRSVVDRALGEAKAGPVHLNVALREPLVPDGSPVLVPSSGCRLISTGCTRPRSPYNGYPDLDAAVRTVVVAGDQALADARGLAEAGGWPLLAEPSSGHGPGRTRSAPTACCSSTSRRHRAGRRRRPAHLLPAGHPTPGPDRPRGGPAQGRPAPPEGHRRRPPRPGCAAGRTPTCSRRARSPGARRRTPGRPAGGPGRGSGRADRGAAGGRLVERDPRPRPGRPRAEPPLVLANRGASGIDGTVSTAIGAALAHAGRPAYALMGDLTFLHDSTGLVIGPAEPRPDLTLVVVNDDGGGLFTLLEQGAPEHAEVFDRGFGTPHGVDLRGALRRHRHTAPSRVESPGRPPRPRSRRNRRGSEWSRCAPTAACTATCTRCCGPPSPGR